MGARARGTDAEGAGRGRGHRATAARQGRSPANETRRLIRGVTYDTGVLVAADKADRHIWKIHANLLREEIVPVVPAPVLAEAWRDGSRQAGLARLLAACYVEMLSEAQARRVGALAGRARAEDIVDVTVVEGAARRGDSVLTSDVSDLRAIAGAVGALLVIEPV